MKIRFALLQSVYERRRRMMAGRIALGLGLLAVLIIAGEQQGSAQEARTITVKLLALNDLHGNLEPPSGAEGLLNQIPAGGSE